MRASLPETELQVLRSIEGVLQLREEWEGLFRRALDPWPFLAPGWLLAWWAGFALPDWSMRFAALRRRGELRAVAPLLIRTESRWGRPCRVLRFWANPSSNRANVLVAADDAPTTLAELAPLLRDSLDAWDLAELGPVALDDDTTRLLRQAFERAGIPCAAEPGFRSPYRPLPNDWATLEASLGSQLRSSLDRKMRRAIRDDLRFDIVHSATAMSEVFDISANTWQHAEGTGVGSTAAYRTYYTRIAEWGERTGALEVALLRTRGEPIAFELNLVWAGVLYNLKLGYRRSHHRLSPGLLLRRYVVEHAVRQGYREFDFLGAAEPYKLEWSTGSRQHGYLLIAGPGPFWRAGHWAWYRARPWAKENLPWLLQLKRRLDRGRSGGGE